MRKLMPWFSAITVFLLLFVVPARRVCPTFELPATILAYGVMGFWFLKDVGQSYPQPVRSVIEGLTIGLTVSLVMSGLHQISSVPYANKWIRQMMVLSVAGAIYGYLATARNMEKGAALFAALLLITPLGAEMSDDFGHHGDADY